MKTVYFTVHKFERNSYHDSPLNALSVEELGHRTLFPIELLATCARQALIYLSEHTEEEPNLEVHFRDFDADEIVHGKYPGVELRENGKTGYKMAWLIVPETEELATEI